MGLEMEIYFLHCTTSEYVACISRYLMDWVEEWLRVGVDEGQLTVLCQGPREPF
jgi:hypothetical protein